LPPVCSLGRRHCSLAASLVQYCFSQSRSNKTTTCGDTFAAHDHATRVARDMTSRHSCMIDAATGSGGSTSHAAIGRPRSTKRRIEATVGHRDETETSSRTTRARQSSSQFPSASSSRGSATTPPPFEEIAASLGATSWHAGSTVQHSESMFPCSGDRLLRSDDRPRHSDDRPRR
jgi:hypothetical protein